ncbi:MAG: hypothetical protein J3K34DRAFT_409522 [Monoraphidium minutum]|nr:MAG: hypothetical protein J3K34DRAFT_409522 [Monoraphidium minutum]
MASYFAANSELAIRVLMKEGPGGQIVIQSREQLTRPGFGCKYEWDGVCKIASHACATGQPVYCTPTAHQVWDSPCGGLVTVPRITHLRLCSTASTGQILLGRLHLRPRLGHHHQERRPRRPLIRSSANGGAGPSPPPSPSTCAARPCASAH